MSEEILSIHNLSCRSDGTDLHDINIGLKLGEVHALIGEKDSENENFVRALSGELSDIRGRAVLKGKRLPSFTHLKQEGVVILRRDPVLFDSFSVAENLLFDRYPRRGLLKAIDWSEVNARARRLLRDLGLDIDPAAAVADLPAKKRKSVAIAKAFVSEPEVIIMQEPAEGLEAGDAQRLHEVIQRFKERNGSIIYITKKWEEVLKIADRISVLNDGTVLGPIPSAEVIRDPVVLLNMLGNYKYGKNTGEFSDDSGGILDAVFKAAQYLTSEYELKDVLLLLAKQAVKSMRADGCIINLIDENTDTIIDTLEFKLQDNIEARLKTEWILHIGLERKDIYYVNKKNPEFVSLFESVKKVKTLICVPLLIRSQVTGVIQILYKDYYVYSEEELMYLSTFARQAAIAIENTRLMGRSALLQESHHRIKNNLQSIISLIAIQRELMAKNKDVSVSDMLDSIVCRIKSIAAVHDLLSKDKSGRSIINIRHLINTIVEFMSFDDSIRVILDADDIFIPYNKASSIALVINELVTNCVKHAFPQGRGGIINISCKRQADQTLLVIQDNGVGLPADFDRNSIQSLGLSIVESIVVNEIKGTIEFVRQDGLQVRIHLPVERLFFRGAYAQ
ncbi:MAG: GAF domain-containing protein [Firmicutes bacterium]|nr:GAF domain-containing protein [Bacillota bacterium]